MSLTTGETTQARRMVEQSMTDRCDITRPSGGNNWDSDPTVTTIASDQPCRYHERASTEYDATGERRVVTAATLTLPAGFDITEADRVTAVVNRLGESLLTTSRGVAAVARGEFVTIVTLTGVGA